MKRLRVRVGPDVDHLETAWVNDESRPTNVDSPFWKGRVLVRIKNFNGYTPDGSSPKSSSEYFSGRTRKFQIQVEGRFTMPFNGDEIWFGTQFDHMVNSFPDSVFRAGMRIAKYIDPAVFYDTHSSQPYIFSPFVACVNTLSAWPAPNRVNDSIIALSQGANSTYEENGQEDFVPFERQDTEMVQKKKKEPYRKVPYWSFLGFQGEDHPELKISSEYVRLGGTLLRSCTRVDSDFSQNLKEVGIGDKADFIVSNKQHGESSTSVEDDISRNSFDTEELTRFYTAIDNPEALNLQSEPTFESSIDGTVASEPPSFHPAKHAKRGNTKLKHKLPFLDFKSIVKPKHRDSQNSGSPDTGKESNCDSNSNHSPMHYLKHNLITRSFKTSKRMILGERKNHIFYDTSNEDFCNSFSRFELYDRLSLDLDYRTEYTLPDGYRRSYDQQSKNLTRNYNDSQLNDPTPNDPNSNKYLISKNQSERISVNVNNEDDVMSNSNGRPVDNCESLNELEEVKFTDEVYQTMSNGSSQKDTKTDTELEQVIESSGKEDTKKTNYKAPENLDDFLGEWRFADPKKDPIEDNCFIFGTNKTVKERRKYFSSSLDHRTKFQFHPDVVYAMSFFSPHMDFNTFNLSLGPIKVNIYPFLEGQPVRYEMRASDDVNKTMFVIEFNLED